eukprot:COSAG01_NODE_1672_length_9554_cov_4.065785_4_plen_153_part_00
MHNRTSLRGDVVDPGGNPGNHTNVKKQVVRTRTQGPSGTEQRAETHSITRDPMGFTIAATPPHSLVGGVKRTAGFRRARHGARQRHSRQAVAPPPRPADFARPPANTTHSALCTLLRRPVPARVLAFFIRQLLLPHTGTEARRRQAASSLQL